MDTASSLEPAGLHLEVVRCCLDTSLDAVEGDDEDPLNHADCTTEEDTVAGKDLVILVLGEEGAEDTIQTEDDDLSGDVADEGCLVAEVELLDATALPELVGAVEAVGVDSVGVLCLC